MTQLDLLEPRCRVPDRDKQKQLYELLMELKRRPVTLWIAIHEMRIGAFSRRLCDLREMGWPIKDRWIKTSGGANVKEFWIE